MRRLLKITRNIMLILAGLTAVGFLGVMFAPLAYMKLVDMALVDPTEDIAVLEIRNQSGALVEEATATLCGHQLRAAKIDPGGAVAMRFRVDCDEADVHVRLASERTLTYDDLATASGKRQHEIITITADRILYQAGPVSEADLAAGRR